MDQLSSISDIKGVGDKTSKLLNKLGVYTIEDILLFFPRTYLVYPKPETPCQDAVNSLFSFAGKLKTFPKTIKTKRGLMTVVTVFCENISLELIWFNAAFVKNSLEPGKTYIFYGKLILDKNHFKMIHPEFYEPEKYMNLMNQIQPIYQLTKGLNNNLLKKAISSVLDSNISLPDALPQELLQKHELVSYDEAIHSYHFPENFDRLKEARRRLAYEEIFFFILNTKLSENATVSFPNEFSIKRNEKVNEVIKELPFELTKGQNECLNEIISDLTGPYISQRLVQGDVGSGKTMVAFLSMLTVCLNGYQAALMAPTEVLAIQHFETFKGLCESHNLNIPVALFTGSQKAAERKQMQAIVDDNLACFIIGTHALISDGREFSNLAFVVTDEQHRFGVKQREKLGKKGDNPHMLVMSATPIPRTLAMILYGNMQVSAIKELPANRLPIKTCVIKESKRNTAYKFLADEIEKGHQVYIICPLVEASETTEAQNVTDYTKELSLHFAGKYSIAMLHGKMKADEKNEIMESFAKGETQILVSTTVVEVGVNVPNATVMMIENANRFGLAGLHQLRGRVGRGDAQSYCILMNSSLDNAQSKRLDIMLKSNDGFYIAQEDLKLRGPGDFFGIRQSGEFNFRIADIFNDADLLSLAAKDVDELLKADPLLQEHENLKKSMTLFLANQSYVL